MKVTVKTLIICCHSISKNLKTEKMPIASCSIFPSWNMIQVGQHMEMGDDHYTIEKVPSPQKTLTILWTQGQEKGQGKEYEWESTEY